MPMFQRRFGELSCVQVDPVPAGERPELLAVFCHGFGAPGNDLVELAPAFCRMAPSLTGAVRWVFPAAPIAPREMADYGGRAWWPINIALLMELVRIGDYDSVRAARPEGMEEASAMLRDAIKAAAADAGLPLSKVVLGGFSQGAMVSTDAALALDESLGGLVLWSGMLLSEGEWKARAPGRAGLPVVQSHGRRDDVLPFASGEALRDLLVAAGCSVEFLPFVGGHAIPPASVEAAARLMTSRLGDRA